MSTTTALHAKDSTTLAESRAMPQERSSAAGRRNISHNEQTFSTLGGAALLLAGLRRGRFSGLLMTLLGGGLFYRGWTGHCHGYEALGIDTSQQPDATAIPAQQGLKVKKSLTINRPAEELYGYWQEVENLPRVMRHLERVEQLEGGRSRWIAKGPLGQAVQWEAEVITQDDPHVISWRSLPGSSVDSAGSIHFRPLGHDRGTALTVTMKYNPPGGKVGAGLAWLFGNSLSQELDEDLRRFKSQMEAGEIPTTAGQSRGG